MKSKALFHLLHMRAKILADNSNETLRAKIFEVQETIKVDHKKNVFLISWVVSGVHKYLEVDDNEFVFYLPGDKLHKTTRNNSSNLREYNWAVACKVWLDIASQSGFNLNHYSNHSNELGISARWKPNDPSYSYGMLYISILSLIFSVTLFYFSGNSNFLICGVLSLLLALLNPFFLSVQFGNGLSIPEACIVIFSAYVPLLFNLNPSWLLPSVGAASVLCWNKNSFPTNYFKWILSGFLLSLNIIFMGKSGLLLLFIIIAITFIISIILKTKIEAQLPLFIFAGMCIGSYLIVLFGLSDKYPVEGNSIVGIYLVAGLLISTIMLSFYGFIRSAEKIIAIIFIITNILFAEYFLLANNGITALSGLMLILIWRGVFLQLKWTGKRIS